LIAQHIGSSSSLWFIQFLSILNKNSLLGEVNIQKGELYVNGISCGIRWNIFGGKALRPRGLRYFPKPAPLKRVSSQNDNVLFGQNRNVLF
jgi:hypothetical protein